MQTCLVLVEARSKPQKKNSFIVVGTRWPKCLKYTRPCPSSVCKRRSEERTLRRSNRIATEGVFLHGVESASLERKQQPTDTMFGVTSCTSKRVHMFDLYAVRLEVNRQHGGASRMPFKWFSSTLHDRKPIFVGRGLTTESVKQCIRTLADSSARNLACAPSMPWKDARTLLSIQVIDCQRRSQWKPGSTCASQVVQGRLIETASTHTEPMCYSSTVSKWSLSTCSRNSTWLEITRACGQALPPECQ